MAIIALPPKFSFTGVPKFGLRRKSSQLRSKYTGQGQYVVFPYAVWMIDGNLLEYDGQDAGNMRAFLVDLEGPKNQFRLPVPGFSTSLTGYTANRLLSVAALARAMSVTVNGGAVGVNYLAKGDFITIQDELKLVTAAVAFNGGGAATISFKPGLRKDAAIGTPVICFQPTVLMRAADDDVATISLAPPVRQGVPNFNAIEAVDI